jgi:hypothetical protein
MVILKHENEALRFALNADGSALIEEKVGGATWHMAAIAWQEEGTIDVGHVWQRTVVRACEQFAGRFRLQVEIDTESIVRCTLLDELHQPLGDFRVRIHLDGIWLRFELLSIDEALPSLVFPPPLKRQVWCCRKALESGFASRLEAAPSIGFTPASTCVGSVACRQMKTRAI